MHRFRDQEDDVDKQRSVKRKQPRRYVEDDKPVDYRHFSGLEVSHIVELIDEGERDS